MSIDPTPGLVVGFDFLWLDEAHQGLEYGFKDRPCVIVLTLNRPGGKASEVVLCPITHSEPRDAQTAVVLPPKVAEHLGLDDDPMWIVTDTVNVVTWVKGQIPFGLTPTPSGNWSYGKIPYALREQVHAQVLENAESRTLGRVRRD